MERPNKEVPSSSGGVISFFSWGLRHQSGRQYSGMTEAEQTEQLNNKTKRKYTKKAQ
jgi:hypothetical protein